MFFSVGGDFARGGGEFCLGGWGGGGGGGGGREESQGLPIQLDSNIKWYSKLVGY